MTTLVLLDTNAYLRLAKRIRPLLGKKFGQKDYVLTVLKDVQNEVLRQPRLQFLYPWFDADELLAQERLSNTIKLSAKLIDNDLVREIYSALEANRDVTASWIEAQHTTFSRIFGKSKRTNSKTE